MLAASATVVIPFVPLPVVAVYGSAIASTVSSGVVPAAMLRDLWRPPRHVRVQSGEPTQELQLLIRKSPFCRLMSGLTDSKRASDVTETDPFGLATRTRHSRHPSSEGFGLVLLEAQVAGTPVVAPACGGSHDAYRGQITGVAPTEATAESLSETLGTLLKDPRQRAQMGQRAPEGARDGFSPEHYASRAVARLL